MLDLHEVLAVLHDLVYRLVGPGQFIYQRLRLPALYPGHRLLEVRHREPPARLRPREPSSCPVRCGVKRHGVLQAGDDVALRAHASGNHAPLPVAHLNRPLASDPDVGPHVVLFLGEIMVALDSFLLNLPLVPALLEKQVGQLSHHAVHHLLAVEQRELLRPEEITNIIPELQRPLYEVGQGRVRQGDEPPLHQPLGRVHVLLRQLVADAPRAGVQHDPDPVILVQGNFNEMIAAAKRAEGLRPPSVNFDVPPLRI